MVSSLGLDLHIGLPPEEEYTVARLTPTPFRYFLKEVWASPALAKLIFSMMYARVMKAGFPEVFKYPDFLKLEGVGRTRLDNPLF